MGGHEHETKAAPGAAAEEVTKMWAEMDAEDAAGTPASIETREDEKNPPAGAEEAKQLADDTDTPPDPWAGASPELLAWREEQEKKNATLEQKLRSAEGRLKPLQRREPAAPGAKSQPAKAREISPELKRAQEEYADVVDPILEELRQTQAGLDELRQKDESRDIAAQRAHDEHVSQQQAILDAEFPDWESLVVDEVDGQKEPKPEFIAWKKRQPRDVQAKIERNANDVVDAAAAKEVLTAYKAFMDRIEAAASPAPGPAADTRKGAGHDALRERQLRASQGARSRSQVASEPGIPKDGDPAAMWAEMDRIEAAAARR